MGRSLWTATMVVATSVAAFGCSSRASSTTDGSAPDGPGGSKADGSHAPDSSGGADGGHLRDAAHGKRGDGTTTPVDAGHRAPGPDGGKGRHDSGEAPHDGGERKPDGSKGPHDGGPRDSAPRDSSTGQRDSSMHAPDTGMGTPDTGTGTPDTSMGIPDTSTGAPDTGTGEPDTGTGEPDTGTGLPDAGSLLSCGNGAATTTGDAGAATGVVSGMVPGPGTFIGGCQIFPADNAWNVDVSSPSIATTAIYTGIPQGTSLHPDLGGWTSSGPYGIPYNVVPAAQPDVTLEFNVYANESDPGPGGWIIDPDPDGGAAGETAYPIPDDPEIEGDPPTGTIVGDDHLLVLQQGATCGAPCMLWETWQTAGGTVPPWMAANGAGWNMGSNALRPLGWTSADAAGLSVFAGLLKISEVKAGVVTHAIRVTFNNTQAGYVFPATHYAGSSALGGSDPPMGLRLRLKASTDTLGFSGPGQIVALAMQTYGLIVADIGSDWYFQGDSDNGWDETDPTSSDGNSYVGELINDFANVTGADFDVLDTGAPQDTGQ